MFHKLLRTTLILIVPVLFVSAVAMSQSRVNSSGTGGIHTIQGRIYMPDGSTVDHSIIVKLESMNFGTVTVYSDTNGAFTFKALAPGNYTVVVDPGTGFEVAKEPITIDPGTGGILRISAPQVFTVPVYLMPQRSMAPKNEVVNAKLAVLPKEVQNLFENGRKELSKGKLDTASTYFQQALASSPNCGPCAIELGKIHLTQGKLDEAASAFGRAIAIDADDFEAHVNLGITLMNEKKYDAAEPELVTAALIDKTAVTPHYYIGLMYTKKKEYEIAEKAFETAKSLPGGDRFPLLHFYLGGIYIERGLNKQAVVELEKYLELMPTAKDADRIKQTISELKKKGSSRSQFTVL